MSICLSCYIEFPTCALFHHAKKLGNATPIMHPMRAPSFLWCDFPHQAAPPPPARVLPPPSQIHRTRCCVPPTIGAASTTLALVPHAASIIALALILVRRPRLTSHLCHHRRATTTHACYTCSMISVSLAAHAGRPRHEHGARVPCSPTFTPSPPACSPTSRPTSEVRSCTVTWFSALDVGFHVRI